MSETNPALGVRLPSMRTVRPKITLEPSQVAGILEALEEPYRTIVLLDAVTGMRARNCLLSSGRMWTSSAACFSSGGRTIEANLDCRRTRTASASFP